MNNKSAKEIVRSYRARVICAVISYIAGIAIFAVLTTKSVLLGIAGAVVLVASSRSAFDKLLEHDIESVIYEDLDPEKFSEILELGVLKRSSRHHVLAAMTSGNHDEVFRLVEANSEKSKLNPVERCNDLYRLGYVYFEKEDWDGLKKTVREFERLKSQNPKLAYAFSTFSVFEKFDAMIDEDYEYVVDACELDISRLTKKEPNHNLTKINLSYYRAVALLKMGKTDEAAEAFREIIAFAPKMHKAKLSERYLESIEK